MRFALVTGGSRLCFCANPLAEIEISAPVATPLS
jgi:hypothetical protein